MQKKAPTEIVLSTQSAPIYATTYETFWEYKEPLEALQTSQELLIPISVFSHKEPTLQLLVRYLREKELLDFASIASLLGRAESTVRVTYRNANKTFELDVNTSLRIPLHFFSTFELSPLETLVYFLKIQGRKNIEIATLLSLDPRTTATVWKRAQTKGVMLYE